MSYVSKHRFVLRLVAFVLTLTLLVPTLAAAPPMQDGPTPLGTTAVVDCDDTTCPGQDPGYGGLDKCVERTNFCVYYTTDSVTETEAEWAADQVQAYWDKITGEGFLGPKYTNKLEVYLEDITGSCNGGTGWSINYMTTYAGCWDLGDDVVQMVLGHEFTHRIQYNYDTSASAPVQTKFLKEGTARATQDNWFTNIDHMPAGAATFTYCAEAASYLASMNVDLSAQWYKSCAWWKWASERYGTIMDEPERGVDFIEAVYDRNTAGLSGIAAVNGGLAVKAPGTDFNESFTKFAVAAYTKDLTGLPDDSYNIIDEDEPGSPGTCGSVTLEGLGPISLATSRQWDDQWVSRYGARYYKAKVGSDCPVITASFHNDGGPAFYHVVTQEDDTFKAHVSGSGTDWTQSFLNDGASRVVAIVGSLDSSAQVDVTLGCADPDIDIQLPNSVAKAHVQPNTKFLAQVLVTDGSPTGPVVAGLTDSDFRAKVGGENASITGGGFIQEQYWLVVRAPATLATGADYDLKIQLEEPGTSTVIAHDTNADAVHYTSDLVDHVLVIDRSGSMGTPIEPTDAKLDAAKDAADFYVDITRNGDGLSVVPYDHNVNPGDVLDMTVVNAAVRADAKNNYIAPLTPGGATSIGDGLFEARNQRVGSTTGNPLCSFVLLSDGMENSERKWDTGLDPVQADVVATGCPVTTIAFGPASNETLMEQIAQDTGGADFYNDVYVSSGTQAPDAESVAAMNLELGDTYEYVQGQSEGRQRILADGGLWTQGMTETHDVLVDDSILEMLFALDWAEPLGYEGYGPDLKLVKPDGEMITKFTLPYTFEDRYAGHLGWRIANPDPGIWQMLVVPYEYIGPYAQPEAEILAGLNYKALASGKSDLTLDLLLPDRLGGKHFTGPSFPIFAILSNDAPVPGVPLQAMVTAPACPGLARQTMLSLHDDGQHGDGAAGDGVYANTYTRVNCSDVVQPEDEIGGETTQPMNEGGYSVELTAGGESSGFQRQAKGAFAVEAGDDTNNNGIPDGWEEEHDITDPNGDPDLDFLLSGDEYWAGTDPNNSDTDGGGENDGSEVDWGQDPLDPSDDEIEAPDFFQAAPDNGQVKLTYDVKGEYAEMELWRATSPDGPWSLHKPVLPLDGSYEDKDDVTNGETYYYRLIGEDDATLNAPGHRTAVLSSEGVTPSTDPVPPEAFVVINGGARWTYDLNVILTFEPYEYEVGDPDGFSDIEMMKISNDPTFDGVTWQDFEQGVPWTLEAQTDEHAYVYVRFKDENGNQSVGTEVGMILYREPGIFRPTYLPLVLRSH